MLLPAKLDAIKEHLQRGTLVYTHYVEGMLPHTRRFVERQGFRTGVYTGTDKSGLTGFLNGQVDVLVASSPVGTGLDGLQKVCHRLIMLCLPWTNAEYEQIIGRIRRQGGAFGEVEIVVPQVLLDYEGDTWSWDRRRFAVIHYKRTLSDCALDGEIPETVRLSPNALLQQGRAALDSWIARVAEHGVLMIDRERLTVPLPDELRHAAVRAHGEFTELNRRWSVSRSTRYASAAPARSVGVVPSTTPCIEKPGTGGLRFRRNTSRSASGLVPSGWWATLGAVSVCSRRHCPASGSLASTTSQYPQR